MTGTRCSMNIDHVGLLGPSIDELVSEFSGLGFSVVGPAELVGMNEAGEPVSLDQHSAHIMFDEDYVELTAVEAHAGENHHLARLLDKPAGLRLIVLRTDNIDPRDYLQRLDDWERRVAEGGGMWRVVNDLERLDRLIVN